MLGDVEEGFKSFMDTVSKDEQLCRVHLDAQSRAPDVTDVRHYAAFVQETVLIPDMQLKLAE